MEPRLSGTLKSCHLHNVFVSCRVSGGRHCEVPKDLQQGFRVFGDYGWHLSDRRVKSEVFPPYTARARKPACLDRNLLPPHPYPHSSHPLDLLLPLCLHSQALLVFLLLTNQKPECLNLSVLICFSSRCLFLCLFVYLSLAR